MAVARPPNPDLTWSFEFPDRLKLAIADALSDGNRKGTKIINGAVNGQRLPLSNPT
jgi:hypothetical protein